MIYIQKSECSADARSRCVINVYYLQRRFSRFSMWIVPIILSCSSEKNCRSVPQAETRKLITESFTNSASSLVGTEIIALNVFELAHKDYCKGKNCVVHLLSLSLYLSFSGFLVGGLIIIVVFKYVLVFISLGCCAVLLLIHYF